MDLLIHGFVFAVVRSAVRVESNAIRRNAVDWPGNALTWYLVLGTGSSRKGWWERRLDSLNYFNL